MWAIEIGNATDFPDAPEGTARLFAHGEYVGTVSFPWALKICKRMNEPPQRVRTVRTVGGAL